MASWDTAHNALVPWIGSVKLHPHRLGVGGLEECGAVGHLDTLGRGTTGTDNRDAVTHHACHAAVACARTQRAVVAVAGRIGQRVVERPLGDERATRRPRAEKRRSSHRQNHDDDTMEMHDAREVSWWFHGGAHL